MLKEILEEKRVNEGILSKINNWFKNIDLVKLTREAELTSKYDVIYKLYPTSIDFLREDNGWNYYTVSDGKKTYLCFLSSSDDDMVKQFKQETKDSLGTFWLSLGKIDDMEQGGVTPYFITELSIDNS